MKKISVLSVLLLLIIPVTAKSINEPQYDKQSFIADSGNIIYVDDDNTEGPWDGTMEHPYYFVQDGVEAANPGDTVYVFSGLYEYQYIEIHETIDLIGEDKNTTIFACNINSWAILIYADYVNVSGFTFTNTGFTKANMLMGINGSYCTITGNIFSEEVPLNCKNAIVILHGHDNTITRNEFTSSSLQHKAIYLVDSNHNTICDNVIEKFLNGIDIELSNENTIINNRLKIVEYGIAILGSFNNKITGNYINGHTIGMFIADSSDNEITYNRFENNTRKKDGIWLYGRYVYFYNSTNYWDNNYWGRERIFPKIIFGYKQAIEESWKHLPNAFEIDWHPAKTPYEI